MARASNRTNRWVDIAIVRIEAFAEPIDKKSRWRREDFQQLRALPGRTRQCEQTPAPKCKAGDRHSTPAHVTRTSGRFHLLLQGVLLNRAMHRGCRASKKQGPRHSSGEKVYMPSATLR